MNTSNTLRSYNTVQLAQHRTNGRVRLAILLVAGSIFIAASYFGLLEYSKNQASQTANGFIAALNAGEHDVAYAETTASLQSKQSPSEFAETLSDLKSDKPYMLYESIDGTLSSMTYTASEAGLPDNGYGSTNTTFTLALVRDGIAGWKVDSILVQ